MYLRWPLMRRWARSSRILPHHVRLSRLGPTVKFTTSTGDIRLGDGLTIRQLIRTLGERVTSILFVAFSLYANYVDWHCD